MGSLAYKFVTGPCSIMASIFLVSTYHNHRRGFKESVSVCKDNQNLTEY